MNKKRPINKNGYDIIVFDCDSTLSKIEGADELAKLKGIKKEISEITRMGMEGLIPFEESLSRRLNILKPSKNDIEWLAYRYLEEVTGGTRKLVMNLRMINKKLYLISGGYTQAVSLFTKYLGFKKDEIFAIDLFFDKDGNFLGFDKDNPLATTNGKKDVLKEISGKGSTIFVGDGSTDLKAKNDCDLFVGYGGVKIREIVKENADIYLEETDLSPIIDIANGLDPFDEERLSFSLSRPGTREMQKSDPVID